VDDPESAANILQSDINKIISWSNKWLVTFNPAKTESILISRKKTPVNHPPLLMLNKQISEVPSHKHLGIFLSNACTWHDHIDHIKGKAWDRINILRKLKFVLDRKSLEIIYFSFIRPLLEYGDVIWDNCTNTQKKELDCIQNEAARIVTGATKLISIENLNNETKWESLESRRKKHRLILLYKILNNITPSYLTSIVPPQINELSRYNLRNADNIQSIAARSTLYSNSFLPSTIRDWNELPQAIKQSDSLQIFNNHLNRDKRRPSNYLYAGERRAQVYHARLRTKCSALNAHLFAKSIMTSPLCECNKIENNHHYFLICPRYQRARHEMLQELSLVCNTITVDILLNGNPSLTLDTNNKLFSVVHKYILSTKRFAS